MKWKSEYIKCNGAKPSEPGVVKFAIFNLHPRICRGYPWTTNSAKFFSSQKYEFMQKALSIYSFLSWLFYSLCWQFILFLDSQQRAKIGEHTKYVPAHEY